LKALINDQVHSIVDCGCGNGFFQTYLREVFQATCVGVDFSPEMLRVNPNPDKIQASVTQLPFEDKAFDLAACSMLLHHLNAEEQHVAVSEMRRVARKYVFIAEPNRNNLANAAFGLLRAEERGLLHFNMPYLRHLCQDNGLEVLNAYVDCLLLPNAMPSFLFPVMRRLDSACFSSWFGFNCNILCRIRF
jgi:ubiquinone/menaquinone biosynthesis C-methylase UbiE